MKLTGRLLVYTVSTALTYGVVGLAPISQADATQTVNPYLPDSPYEARRRAQLNAAAPPARSRLPNPQVIYQDSPALLQSDSGMVSQTPTTLDAPLPLEVAPLYPTRGVTSTPPSVSPVTQQMLEGSQQDPYMPIASFDGEQMDFPEPVHSSSGLSLPPPPGAPLGASRAEIDTFEFEAYQQDSPIPQPEMRRVVTQKHTEKADSLWDYLTQDGGQEVGTYEPVAPSVSSDSFLPPPPPSLGTPSASFAQTPTIPFQPAPPTNIVNLDIAPAPSAQMPEPIRSPHNALSSESRQLLSNIPSSLEPKPEPVRKVTVSRIDPDIANILNAGSDSNISESTASLGVKVKQPNYNVDYELEKAYQAVLGGSIEQAIEIYKDALSVAPRNLTGLFGLASTYHRIGSLDNARALYARLLEIAPDNREGLNNFLALVSEESPEEALPELQVLANKHPGFSPILAQLGWLYHKLGEHGSARQYMLRAVRITPENMTYRYNLAIMLDQQGAYAEAANVYRYLIGVSQRGIQIPASPDDLQARLTYILTQV